MNLRPYYDHVLVAIFIAIAIVRIATTWPVLSHTTDEGPHIDTGLEWLELGTYKVESLHPPLARISAAFLPWMNGRVLPASYKDIWVGGNELLHQDGEYRRTLTLARLGIIPWFILAAFTTWRFGRLFFGRAVGLIAVGLFTLLPPALAHAGLATTDMPATAAFVVAVYAWVLWLERRDVKRSVLLGLAVALALTTKFSLLIFLPITAFLILALRLIQHRKDVRTLRFGAAGGRFALAILVCFISIWGVYRFSFGPVLEGNHLTGFQSMVESKLSDKPALRSVVTSLTTARVPFPEFFNGIGILILKNEGGHAVWLLGKPLNGRASPWFFPVAIAVKTPIPFIILFLTGIGISIVAVIGRGRASATLLVPLIPALTVLAIAMEGNINIGLRHVLPMYPFLAVIAAIGGVWLWKMRWQPVGKGIVGVLGLWLAINSASAHPDYLTWFNEIAGDHPDYYLIDGDLDWGQDFGRLTTWLREHDVDGVSIATSMQLNGWEPYLPPFEHLERYAQPRYEWVAVSYIVLKGWPGYEWLERYEPVAKIGSSILVYRVPLGNAEFGVRNSE